MKSKALADIGAMNSQVDMGKTLRGFDYAVFNDYYGYKCSLQKSSIATDDCILLGIHNPEPKIMVSVASNHGIDTNETTGWVPYQIPEDVSINTRMHLSQNDVIKLLPYLQRFADTGDLVAG